MDGSVTSCHCREVLPPEPPRPSLLPALLIAVALVVALLAVPPASAASAASSEGYVTQAESATNARREARGLRPLGSSACLQRFAVAQAERMARDNSLSHTEQKRILSACGLSRVGENVAQALSSDQGGAVVRSWMRSSDHRANILARGFRTLGMAAVRRGDYWYVVQVFGGHRL